MVVDLQDRPARRSCPAWPDGDRDASSPTARTAPTPRARPAARCTSDADCDAGAVCNERIGSCVCLHNGWKRDTEDDSSRVTSSSVFDFNGDGAAEVVYNDECYFRVYDGHDGEVLFTAALAQPHQHREPGGRRRRQRRQRRDRLPASTTAVTEPLLTTTRAASRYGAERHRGLGRPQRHLGLGAPHLEPARATT